MNNINKKTFFRNEYNKYINNLIETRRFTMAKVIVLLISLICSFSVYFSFYSNKILPLNLQKGEIIQKIFYRKYNTYYGYNLIEYKTSLNTTVNTCINEIVENTNITKIINTLDTYNIGAKYIINVDLNNEYCYLLTPEMREEHELYIKITVVFVLLIFLCIMWLKFSSEGRFYKSMTLKEFVKIKLIPLGLTRAEEKEIIDSVV